MQPLAGMSSGYEALEDQDWTLIHTTIRWSEKAG